MGYNLINFNKCLFNAYSAMVKKNVNLQKNYFKPGFDSAAE